jgi:spore maturation protein CgeB
MNNILIIGHFYEEGFATHIYENLTDNGNYVFKLDVGFNINWPIKKNYFTKFDATIQQLIEKTKFFENNNLNKILHNVDEKEISLIIVCHDFLTPNQVEEIKKNRNIKIVLWFPDPIGQIHRGMFMNANYDILFFKDKYICQILKNELNLNAEYLPECCNPKYHRIVEINEQDILKYGCDITTAGNLPTNRIRLFEQIAECNNYNIKLWGNKAPHWANVSKINSFIKNEFVANIEKSKAFRAAKIVINNLRISEVEGTNVRTFEIAACGGFQITTFRQGIYELYNEDELITYKSFNELIEKIDYYLSNPNEREIISKKAFIRTQSEHTYNKRLEQMFEKINRLQ